MKKIIIVLLLLSTLLLSENINNNVIMIKVTPNFKAKKTDLEILSTSIEMNLTKLGYNIISKAIQEEALKEQREQQNSDCYDDKCLVDTGRMLAARRLLMVNISKRKKTYFVKFKKINIETGLLEGSDFTVIDINYDDEKAHEKITKVMESLFVKKELNDINNLVTINVSASKSGATIKIDGKVEGQSIVKKIVNKGKHKVEISKKHYKPISAEIDTKTSNTFRYKLIPIDYEIEIDSKHKDASFYIGTNRSKEYKAPFKITSNMDKKTLIVACKEGYEMFSSNIGVDKNKINIDLKKRPKYKVTVSKPKGYKFTYEERNNPCGYGQKGKGKSPMTLYKGNYSFKFTKANQRDGYRYFSLYGDKTIYFYEDKNSKFGGDFQLITEYNYTSDDISKRENLYSGILFSFEKTIKNDSEMSIFAIGFLGDFFYSDKKSYVFRFGFVPAMYKQGWIFTQVSLFGIGGYLDLNIYDDHILLNPFSIKLGLDIPLGNYFSIKIYGTIAWVTEWFEDGVYENDGYNLTGGIILESRYN